MQSKYKQIFQDYVGLIDSKKIQPGERIPSESSLMRQYGVSRDTVRKAMTLLEQGSYIKKSRGKESVVLDSNKYDFPVSKIVSFKEQIAQQGWNSVVTTVADISIVEDLSLLGNEKEIITEMNLSKDEMLYRVIRIREIDGERIILDKDYFRIKCIPKLTKEICENSIYAYIENELGLNIGTAKKVVTVQGATSEDVQYLDLHDSTVVAVVSSYTTLEDGTVFQYTESRHRIDKFRFTEFAKR